jgi:hypothetical protein
MVGSLRIWCDGDGDADDAKEHENQRPPGEVGEAAADGWYYRTYKSDDPGKLSYTVSPSALQLQCVDARTMPIEMVASAKGSPTMRPTENLVRPL